MPAGQSADYILNGKPFMLVRGSLKGRAWKRVGLPNTVRPPITIAEAGRSRMAPEVDFVAVYDDWSGGFGAAYRESGQPEGYHWAENFDLRWPRQAVHCQRIIQHNTGTGALQIDNLIDLPMISPNAAGAGIVLAYGREAARRFVPITGGPAPSEWETALELSVPGNTLTNRAAIFGSYSYLPYQDQIGFLQRGHNALYTQAPVPGRGFVVAGTRLWRFHGPAVSRNFYVQSIGQGLDPLGTANWSATLTIGDGFTNINDIAALGEQVFIGTPDGLYAGDTSGTFYNVLSDLQQQRNVDNCRDLTIHNGRLIANSVAGLFAFKPSDFLPVAQEIGPRGGDRSPVRGTIRANRSYAGWLYSGLWTGSQSYVMAGLEQPDGSMRWHTQQRLPDVARIQRLHFDGITTSSGAMRELPGRMWVVTDMSLNNGVAPIYFMPIPRQHRNPLASDPVFSANYVGSARMDMGRDNRGAPDTLKVLRRVDVNTDASTLMSGAQYADIYYAVDGGARTLLGRAQQSPRTTLYFSSGVGSFVIGYDFEMSVESFTGSASATPVYRSLVVHGAFLPNGIDQIAAITRIADNQRDRNGVTMRSGAAQVAELRAMAGGPPVQLLDLTGAVNWVLVERDIEEGEVYQEGSDNPEVAVTVKMAVLDINP